MPRIEVYRGAGQMVPISIAKKVKAFQCPWTDKIFSKKADYVKHLKNLRETRMHTIARQRISNKVKQDLWNQPTFGDVINWVSIHPEFMFNLFLNQEWEMDKKYKEKYRNTFMVEITYLNLRWSDSCSNTHKKPHNGVTNWDGRELLPNGLTAPRGYAGWRGDIEFKTNCDMTNGSRVFSDLRINTGTGGARNDHQWGFDVTFFADDWPELYKEQKHAMAEDLIMNNPEKQYTYTYGIPKYFR